MNTVKIGDDWRVWWNTGRPKVGSYYPARVIAIEPYTGPYQDLFTHILTLAAPNTDSGATQMSANLREERPL